MQLPKNSLLMGDILKQIEINLNMIFHHPNNCNKINQVYAKYESPMKILELPCNDNVMIKYNCECKITGKMEYH